MTDTTLPDPPADADESLTRIGCRLHRRSQIAHLDQPVPWVWHGYLARHSITLLTGQWKVGKTTLLSALLARMGGGGGLAGLPVAPGRAVVVTEEGAALWAPRLARHAVGDWAAFAFRPFARKPQRQHWEFLLADLAELHAGRPIDLAVIDPLVAVLPGGEETNAEAMMDALRPLRDLAARGPAVLLLHHPRKGSALGGQGARGTGALPAFVDVLMEMDWPGPAAADTRRRRLTAWSRHEATPRRVLVELSADGREYMVVADDGPVEAADDVDRSAEAVLRARPGLTAREVCARWPMGVAGPGGQAMLRRLNGLTEAGRLIRGGGGHKGSPYRFWVVEAAEPAGSAAGLPRDGVEAVGAEEFAGVGEVGLDVGPGQTGVVVDELVDGPTLGHQVDDEPDGQPRPADDGLAAQDGWVDDDSIRGRSLRTWTHSS